MDVFCIEYSENSAWIGMMIVSDTLKSHAAVATAAMTETRSLILFFLALR